MGFVRWKVLELRAYLSEEEKKSVQTHPTGQKHGKIILDRRYSEL